MSVWFLSSINYVVFNTMLLIDKYINSNMIQLDILVGVFLFFCSVTIIKNNVVCIPCFQDRSQQLYQLHEFLYLYFCIYDVYNSRIFFFKKESDLLASFPKQVSDLVWRNCYAIYNIANSQ